jgi:Arc/MetJ family transcription regulator
MRTNIDIDPALIKEAMAATGQTTMKATVELALKRVVDLARQRRAGAELAGLGWEGNLTDLRESRQP